MIGYKAFNKDLTCRGFQYEIGNEYILDGDPIPCHQGFHFCKTIADTYGYYDMSDDTRICKVEALGKIETDDGIKYCTNKIRILEEVTEEYIRKGNINSSSSGYCNSGNNNSGDYNSGDYNSGDMNSGNGNAGNCDSGNRNSGYRNSGNRNSGYWNTGNGNSGNGNAGNSNSGDWNTGNGNSGDRNRGNCNTGDWNTGYYNSGDWNLTNFSAGCFNTERETIRMFNKESDWTLNDWWECEARDILNGIPKNVVNWIHDYNMTDEEKEKYPTYKTTGGYLKVLNDTEAAQAYWDNLSERKKEAVYSLPNFDKDIFEECTGIKI